MFSITQMAHIIALRATLRFRPLSGIVFSIAAHYEKFGFGGNCFRPLSGIVFSIAYKPRYARGVADDSFRPLSGIMFSIHWRPEWYQRRGNHFRPLSGIMFSILALLQLLSPIIGTFRPLSGIMFSIQNRQITLATKWISVSVPSRGLCFQFILYQIHIEQPILFPSPLGDYVFNSHERTH